jgi:GT2 family glycosyltransferase/glycosyltransferase involved in cell wall biosynthesis
VLRDDWLRQLAGEARARAEAALAEGDGAASRAWLERAHRILPDDATIVLALAMARLREGDPYAAATLLAPHAERHHAREAWLVLARAWRDARNASAAAKALGRMLAGHVLPATGLASLADSVAHMAGAAGWCGLRADGRLLVRAAPGAVVEIDGSKVKLEIGPGGASAAVPADAVSVSVTLAGRTLLGSPIDARARHALEGFVAARAGALEGWAWHPADPDRVPVLEVAGGGEVLAISCGDEAVSAAGLLSRPRGFHVPEADLRRFDGPVSVTGAGLRHLLGSPLDPFAEQRSAASAARSLAARLGGGAAAGAPQQPSVPADVVGRPAQALPVPERAVAVVVPVHRGLRATLDCLDSVARHSPEGTAIVVVDDASPEPALSAALDRLAQRGRIVLLRNEVNLGFPASANAGLRRACALPGGRDVVLLNSDTLVPPGWLARLRAVVHSGADIGTATPLSNDATICSYPAPARPSPAPLPDALRRLDRLAARANGGVAVEIPTAVGFCMYLRRECLNEVGPFREDAFAQGYGEENDFCLRARHLGWRHVAAPGVFVAHAGGESFGAAKHLLVARNLDVLERLHPGYRALIAAFEARDPLAPARRQLDIARWRAVRPSGSVLMVTHDSGGGVERVLRDRAAAAARSGLRAVVLRPACDRTGEEIPGLVEVDDGAGAAGTHAYPNLRFAIPAELPALARLLAASRPTLMEVHHLLGHDHHVLDLARRLGVPTEWHVHDYALLCPRVTLVGADRRYCGEPLDTTVCDACIADTGSNLRETIGTAALRARSAAHLAAARRVVVPSADTAARLRRHFPALAPVVEPLQDDTDLPPLRPGPPGPEAHVCVVGALGTEKGYDVLLACARDAAARGLKLRFTLVGHTADDARLIATGRVFVTGPYEPGEAVALIVAQRAHLAFLPAIWPETWCFVLGEAWQAGLAVAAFDIGAPAERIRRTGRGFTLPLGLRIPAINNALLAASAPAGHECAPVGQPDRRAVPALS